MDILSKPVLKPSEVSRVLSISRSQVYQAVKSGEIPHFKVGTRICIPTHAIRKMIGLEEKASA